MPSASLGDLLAHSRVDKIPAGEQDGRWVPVNELRVVLEGDLRVVADGTVLGRGNFFGEASLLDLTLRTFGDELETAHVESKNGCTCLVIDRHELNKWMERHPHLQAALYQHLSQELFNRGFRKAA